MKTIITGSRSINSLEERERQLSGNNPFAWHKPSANDLLPSSKINVTPVDLNVPIEFK